MLQISENALAQGIAMTNLCGILTHIKYKYSCGYDNDSLMLNLHEFVIDRESPIKSLLGAFVIQAVNNIHKEISCIEIRDAKNHDFWIEIENLAYKNKKTRKVEIRKNVQIVSNTDSDYIDFVITVADKEIAIIREKTSEYARFLTKKGYIVYAFSEEEITENTMGDGELSNYICARGINISNEIQRLICKELETF